MIKLVQLKGADLLLFQKVLGEIRQQTHSSNKYLVELEHELIEKAAELGNRDALTILSYEALSDKTGEYTEDDKKQASIFTMKLSRLNHPLVFKMAGDYQYKEGKIQEAIKLYQKFLKLDYNSILSAEVYKTLGTVYFQQGDLIKARLLLEKSINLAPVSKVSQSHFLLGLIYELDPKKARYHFEMSASEGFRESYKNLGFLELNYFNSVYKAKEWFKLGAELGDHECMIGLFDCNIKEKDWKAARSTFKKLLKFVVDNKLELNLHELRAESIQLMNREEKVSSSEDGVMSDNSRWDK
ncbi:hypothetical protein CANARDRAFT_26460 [[Candida] arabinofermentans NRRL YB-2248]|uniref:Uncharacterized protein n=1 Tax=[Candida] arabinofermentans NRRL YB-2248 TaxID=983967 RepID=A0A1E4T974_9ASCO|nr:hypothetical protein CANARDRAFT_26460 [[Candida] arabinofermentans NRRL YB-2248]